MACFPHSQILVWVITLALAQTASYVIHKENVDLATEMNDGTHTGANLGDDETISPSQTFLESLLNVSDMKLPEVNFTAEAARKGSQLDKEKIRKCKKMYQSYIQMEQSFERERYWLSVIKRDLCRSCFIMEICDHSPTPSRIADLITG